MLWRVWGNKTLLLMGLKAAFLIAASALQLAPLAHASRILSDAFITRPFSFQVWQSVLTQVVDASAHVDVVKLRANPLRLQQYLAQLERMSPENRPAYFPTQADRLAYWLNAYNAVVLSILLEHYPHHSLNTLPDLSRLRYRIGQRWCTLSDLRQSVVREAALDMPIDMPMDAPHITRLLIELAPLRPKLWREAYEGSRLSSQMSQVLH